MCWPAQAQSIIRREGENAKAGFECQVGGRIFVPLSLAMQDVPSPENPPVEINPSLPGAVAEVYVPVPTLDTSIPLDTSRPAVADAPVYSPRTNFVPPDVETALLHAKENRPMKRDSSGSVVPYVLTLCRPCADHNCLSQVSSRHACN